MLDQYGPECLVTCPRIPRGERASRNWDFWISFTGEAASEARVVCHETNHRDKKMRAVGTQLNKHVAEVSLTGVSVPLYAPKEQHRCVVVFRELRVGKGDGK